LSWRTGFGIILLALLDGRLQREAELHSWDSPGLCCEETTLEDEIDLRAYVTILFRHKFWIVGLTLIAALTAFGVSSLLPPTYEATALVAAIKPSHLIQFDPRVQTVQTQSDLQPSYRAYPALALGDELAAKLERALAAELSSMPYSLAELQKKMEAQGGTDASIIELTVKDKDPVRAATIVNLWAELFRRSTRPVSWVRSWEANARPWGSTSQERGHCA